MLRLVVLDVDKVYSRSERRPKTIERYIGEFELPREVSGSAKKIARKNNESLRDVFMAALCCYFGDGQDNFICKDCERFPYLRVSWEEESDNSREDYYDSCLLKDCALDG